MSLTGTTINPAILTSQSSTDKTTVATVTSNSTSGYTLSATTSSSDGTLIGDDSSENTIAYVGTGYGSASEGWALSVGGSYKAISGNKISLFTSDDVADNEDTTVNYSFKTSSTTIPDTYRTTLTYTASVK